MDNNNFDYIVKCKEIDIEIDDTIQKRNNTKDLKNFMIFLCIIFIFFISRIYDANPKLLLPGCIFFAILIILVKLVLKKPLWKLKIQNRKIYIDLNFGHHVIDYSDLVNFELTKVWKRVARYNRIMVDALVVTYLKNGKLKRVVLETQENLNQEIKEICKSFIRKSQLDINPSSYYYDYFDIGGEDIDTKLKALEKYNNKKSIILTSILLVMIITLLFFCYNLFKVIL